VRSGGARVLFREYFRVFDLEDELDALLAELAR
jgi:hypothetical protein